MPKLVLIDSNALVHRAFHALPPTLTSPSGLLTNAVYGFTAVLLKMLKDLKPEYVAASFDLAGPTFRHDEFAEYKAHRVKAPDELYAQIPMVKKVLAGFGIPIYEAAGFEADDVIGSLAEQAKKNKNLQVVIVTGDMDTLQLVDEKKVVVFTLRKGVTDTVTYDEQGVRERYGIAPEQMTDFKGLKGDPSDNIPGVPGIGEKTATNLIQTYGSLERLYQELGKAGQKNKKISKTAGGANKILTENLAAKLREHRDIAFFSKKLATIIRTVDVGFSLTDTEWRNRMNLVNLERLFREYGFFSLLKRLPEALGQTVPEQASLSLKETSESTKPVMKNGELIGHDLKPYLKNLRENGRPLPKKIFDTRVAAWLLNPDRKNYDLPRVWEGEFSSVSGGTSGDLPALRDRLHSKLQAAGLRGIFEDIEMPLEAALADMELFGIAVDRKVLAALSKTVSASVAALEKEIYRLAGTLFNINSPQQLSEILFTRLAIRGKVRRTGGGAISTAAEELEKIRDEHPIVPKVLEYRELQKLKTTYIDPFPGLIAADGRVHTTYNQTGTGTGRLASQDPNLQNIPTRTELGREFRKAFIAGKGYVLATFDYSQLELRLAAHIAKDTTMIEAFRRGEDIHTRTAVEIFGVDPASVTRDMRRQAKALNFGLIYGMGVLGFARTAGVDRIAAQEFINRYFDEFSGIAHYMENTKRQVARDGYATTLFGRRRPLPDINSTMPQLRAAAERMAINHPIQGTEADLIKMAMNATAEYIRAEKLQKDVRMLLQVHDELVFEIKEDLIAKVVPRIKKLMEKVHDFDVPIVVDIKTGSNWAEMETVSF